MPKQVTGESQLEQVICWALIQLALDETNNPCQIERRVAGFRYKNIEQWAIRRYGWEPVAIETPVMLH